MSRFKHRLKEPFGKAGLTVAVIALVMALVGGAYAAGGLTKSQEKQVKKIAKKYAGKPGATGPAGPAGPQGPAGTNGKDGAKGDTGALGTNGKSVVIQEILTGEPECSELGGAKLEKEGEPSSATEICNGQTGFTPTLPSGKTEMGTIAAVVSSAGGAWLPFSFNIPLAAHLENAAACGEPSEPECQVHFVTQAEVTAHTAPSDCPGTSEAPAAEPGSMCMYETPSGVFHATINGIEDPTNGLHGASVAGGFLSVSVATAPAFIRATWAVTAP
jgi:hypothetical protein